MAGSRRKVLQCCFRWLLLLEAGWLFLPTLPVARSQTFPITQSPTKSSFGLAVLQAPMDSFPDAKTKTLPGREGKELSLAGLVQEVLARNPSLAQMVAAWEAANARYPQVTSLDDPMFGGMLAPPSFASNAVQPGYRVEVSQ